MEKEILRVVDDQGNEVDCEILGIFANPKNGREYVLYTDGTYSGVHERKTYVSIRIQLADDSFLLIPPQDDKDMEMIEKYLRQNGKF